MSVVVQQSEGLDDQGHRADELVEWTEPLKELVRMVSIVQGKAPVRDPPKPYTLAKPREEEFPWSALVPQKSG